MINKVFPSSSGKVSYQCGNPFVKLKVLRTDVSSINQDMPQFGFGIETLF
jgi:hypothetical protein